MKFLKKKIKIWQIKIKKEKEDKQKNERIRTPIKTENINAVAEFDLKHMGETGNIFETSQVGKNLSK